MAAQAITRRRFLRRGGGLVAGLAAGGLATAAARPARATASGEASPGADLWIPSYPDGRPVATLRMDAQDAGVVLRHGDGPARCDVFGARDVWVFSDGSTYYMHYDAAGDDAWLTALATSSDGTHWTKQGTVLDLGAPGAPDSASASYGTTYRDGDVWRMFYIGTQNVSPPHNIPALPYVTLKAKSSSPTGPWTKQYDVIPFAPRPGTYYAQSASAGQIIEHGGEYLQFFSASAFVGAALQRTISIARTHDLDGTWTVDDTPALPLEEQIENSALYYERAGDTWYLFVNHVGLDPAGEYTDAIWVYWSDDPTRWSPDRKAVVLDRNNVAWSQRVVGLPSVLPIGNRLAIFYDGAAGASTSHLDRDIGLAWLDLPLRRPDAAGSPPNLARGATATASTTYPGYDPARVVDGSPSTALGDAHSWANAYESGLPQWVQIEFARPETFARVELYTTSGFELTDYRLQRWNGDDWVDLVEPVRGNTTVHRTHMFHPVTAQRIRVVGERTASQPGFVRVNEIEVYAPPV